MQSLSGFFHPSSIAVIGASDRHLSVGKKVFSNLLAGKYEGRLFAINPKYKEVQGHSCFASVKNIADPIDLAVIATPAHTLPTVIRECGEKGIKSAIIISSGFSETGATGKTLEQSILQIAKQYDIRIIGPNCLGIMRPLINMNATFDNNIAQRGNIALVSQSGAICAAILDWAVSKKIGFSALISIGNSADVDFGEILDYLANDPETKSILLYIEGIHDAKRFLHGLRTASQKKPVIVIKVGRNQQGTRAALSHTGALIGDDDAFDVALRQSGAVRVKSIEELFTAAEILANNKQHIQGNRLMVITNGGGAGVLAADSASSFNVSLPPLNEILINQLNQVLPAQWSHQNPIDIVGDASPERYLSTLKICGPNNEVDAFLVILVPVAAVNPLEVAQHIIQTKMNKLMLTCWMGEEQVKSSWKIFQDNHLPCFDTPEKAIAAFSYLYQYHQNQQYLLHSSTIESLQPAPDSNKAKQIIAKALSEGRHILTAIESKQVLAAFHIPTSLSVDASTPDEAMAAALSLGFPVAMKINSPDITHKQDVGGVALNIINEAQVHEHFTQLMDNARNRQPNAHLLGVTVERMFKSPNDRETMIGIFNDKVFGPVISFGAGGTLVEIINDRALGLLPLNRWTAEQLIQHARVAKLLNKFRHLPPAQKEPIIETLLRVSQMISELPEIQEMDINPFTVNDHEARALDARIVIRNLVA